MFKRNTKKHNMKLRNREKFKVTHAKTVRMNKSTIPYLQKLLNLKHTKIYKLKMIGDY